MNHHGHRKPLSREAVLEDAMGRTINRCPEAADKVEPLEAPPVPEEARSPARIADDDLTPEEVARLMRWLAGRIYPGTRETPASYCDAMARVARLETLLREIRTALADYRQWRGDCAPWIEDEALIRDIDNALTAGGANVASVANDGDELATACRALVRMWDDPAAWEGYEGDVPHFDRCVEAVRAILVRIDADTNHEA